MCRVARVPQRSSRCVGPTVRDTNTATLGNSKSSEPAPSEWREEATLTQSRNSVGLDLSFELFSLLPGRAAHPEKPPAQLTMRRVDNPPTSSQKR